MSVYKQELWTSENNWCHVKTPEYLSTLRIQNVKNPLSKFI